MSANETPWREWCVDDVGPIEVEMPCDDGPCMALFDPAEVRSKLHPYQTYDGFGIGDQSALSNEEEAWRKRLQQILDDPKNPQRKLLIASEGMLSAIGGLERIFTGPCTGAGSKSAHIAKQGQTDLWRRLLGRKAKSSPGGRPSAVNTVL